MNDFIVGGVLGMALGMWLGYLMIKLAMHIATKKLMAELDQLQSALEKGETMMIPCRVESHEGIFFVYNNDTNEFMAQGSTLDELREKIKARWKDQRVSVVAGDDAVLEQLKAQINESSHSQ